ncbi:[FeFe] hydrogenase H-cluster maturation GTPase HydF [Geofilum rubicundum]|uniref:Putative GTP-binding protien TM0445 n=1 Tax=Geofilum rubicundum JCM 15548 TaxID=1236989 RepID=A0A0E9LW60_9BACT|nr:[FeFe] hydrogenase H-cluster maturation GTPase HydF [Geofilum rubicundum]GAO29100.1 putative GTP-binding protien TM0445 [Geofilum rubicundum JCM 15548]
MARDKKPHIGFFGKRNNGKSTLINAITGQDIAITSPVAGTTTDPVKKSIEIKGVGPAILIDTAGIDDSGELGEKRIAKSLRVLDQIDLAILIIINNSFDQWEHQLIEHFRQKDVPFMVIHGKSDLQTATESVKQQYQLAGAKAFLAYRMGEQVDDITRAIQSAIPPTAYTNTSLLAGIIEPGDQVLLITPVDTEAPEGRMILPQVQTIRDVLDNHAINIVLKESELALYLSTTSQLPKIAITDSQIFEKANRMVPKEVMLTGFSILLARHKGNFEAYRAGTPRLGTLKKGDRILILESCTHHSTCEDIGRVKLPRWIQKYIHAPVEWDVVAGLDHISRPITDYALIIQCGGCMITRKQLHNRLQPAIDAGIPVTNYGMAIAWMHGIYERAMQPFEKR